MLNKWVSGVAVMLVTATAGVAVAQQVQRQVDTAQPPLPSEEQIRARQKISTMEGVLERAVANGAENVMRRVQAVMPVSDGPFMLGTPSVRGFRLDGFGVFFDVDVPELRIPISWTLSYLLDANGLAANTALAQLRSVITRRVTDPQERFSVEQALRRLELQVGPSDPGRDQRGGPATATLASQSAPGQRAALPPMEPALLEGPGEVYTREVKAALIEAMLESTGALTVGPDEFLAVAARENNRDSSNAKTVMFRVKGSDLAAFRGGRITADEAKQRVDVREY